MHMRKHRDRFLEDLTEDELRIHDTEVEKGTMEKVIEIIRSKDPEAAAAAAEAEHEQNNAEDHH